MVRKRCYSNIFNYHNEGKSADAERYIKKVYRYMTSISKIVYFDKLDEIVNKYNNIYHRTIKMKPVDVKSNTYVNSIKEINDKDSKLDKLDIPKLKNVQTNLSNLKSKLGKVDYNPVDWSKLNDDGARNDVYNAKIKHIEDKIPDFANLTTNTTINAERNKVKNVISSITNLATTTALTT